MIDPKCCRCRRELEARGGVLLMPPHRSVQRGTLEADLVDKFHLCVECAYDVFRFLVAVPADPWRDVPDEWTEAIKAAHPARDSESHDEYGVAMQMVGHRQSKGELVALVNWLLVRIKQAKETMQ